ncbi:GDSL esterase/lipase 6 [Impatiens glandulifera]|uniref:GDSL esterase/lipase 6 n=1 Tax=Impatiens glandulifera TaxID=253017 RepID=UPI001FB146FE|nr:GDSL esterase/lipase 6 [Impatiens glandulifera]
MAGEININIVTLLLLTVFAKNLFPANGSHNRVQSIFSFGDSLLDAGNNHYKVGCKSQADFPPYGSTFFHHPTGRFTNGRIVVDFISELLEINLQKSYLEAEMEVEIGNKKYYPSNGLNFASASSGVLPWTNGDLGIMSIQDQLKNFHSILHKNKIPKEQVRNSLYFFESGSNDIYGYFLNSNSTIDANTYIQAMLKEVDNFINKIYKLGARKIVVYSLGLVGCVPARVLFPGAPTNIECFEKMNTMAKDYNKGLEILVLNMPKKYHGSIGILADVYTIVEQLRATPEKYGLSNVSHACCGHGTLRGSLQCGKKGYELCKNPNEYLFWDYFHPSEHAYELVTKEIWSGKDAYARPFNLKTLVNKEI